jgi:hypothetical protein
MTEWININDKIPARLTPVIIYAPKHNDYAIGKIAIYIACFCDWIDSCKHWHFLPQPHAPHDISFEDVTHWMPLPEIPNAPI